MNSWVFDTNVIVAAHLSPFGVPARLLSEVYARRLRMSYDFRILAEYQEVLGRKKIDLPPQAIKGFLQIVEDQERMAPLALKTILPNPDDLMFLEVAAATSHRVLVTGNIKHHPQKSRGSVLVLPPAAAFSLHLK
jgi:putative PIN family toxin of toxin-antitoxin system